MGRFTIYCGDPASPTAIEVYGHGVKAPGLLATRTVIGENGSTDGTWSLSNVPDGRRFKLRWCSLAGVRASVRFANEQAPGVDWAVPMREWTRNVIGMVVGPRKEWFGALCRHACANDGWTT
jgi:hypothetical protein